MTDASYRTRTTGYDRLNRQTSVTVPGTSRTITDTYDGAGDMTSYTDGNDTISYTYDAANGLKTIVDAAGTFQVSEDHDGNRSSIAEPNGVTISTSYHANHQVNTISTSGGSGLPGKYNYNYTYPGLDGHTHETDTLQELNITGGSDTFYGYDNNDRLCWVGTASFTGSSVLDNCSSTTSNTNQYSYDKNGDLTQATAGATTNYFGFTDAGQLCYSGSTDGTDVGTTCPSTTPGSDTSYTSDNAGNLTGSSTTSSLFTYNNANQATTLTAVNGSGGGNTDTADYIDEGNDLRDSVTASANTTTLDNGPLGITARTTTSGPNTGTTYYTRDPQGNLIDERGPGGTYYYLTDRQNTVISLISSTGTDAGDYTYRPYGGLTSASLTTAAQNNPFRYDSAYQDIEGDNLYHLGARYYDPNTTYRFTQPDTVYGTIANPNTTNLYGYTGGDPTNNSDPSGHDFGEYASACGKGAVSGLAIGAVGPDETGVGAVTDALGGCAQGIAETFVDHATNSALGSAAGALKDVSDFASNLLGDL